MAQLLRPTDDIETAGWTTTPLFSKIDEPYPGSTDRIVSSSNPVNVDCEVGLASGSDPGTNKGHTLRARISNSAAGPTVDYTVELKEGATVRATLSVVGVATTTDTWYAQHLTEGEAGAITDYTNLSIRVNVNKTGGSNVNGRVEALELEIPDVGTADTAIPGGIAASKVRCWWAARLLVGLSDGATPSSLQDESGNGNSLYGSNPGTYKTGIVNDLPVIQFDGVNDQYRMFWPSAAERITYFFVLKHLTIPVSLGQSFAMASGEGLTGDKVAFGTSFADVVGGQANYLMEQAGVGQHVYCGANQLDTTNFVYLRARYGAGATGDTVFIDGVQQLDGESPGDAGSNSSTGIKLGSREDDTRFWNGQIAEFLCCQGLSNSEEVAVESALMSVYGGGSSNRMGGSGAIRHHPHKR